LTRHVILPLAGTVKAITIALNCESPPFAALDDEINTVAATMNLGLGAEAAFYELIE